MSKNDSIAFYAKSCTALFEELHRQLQRSTTGKEISPETILEESKRFALWAKNIVALQDAHLPSSLEYRIRDDKTAIKAVKRALEYLAESLEIVSSIASGNKENETWEVQVESSLGSSLGDVKIQKVSETTELLRAIQDGIASLFQLSMIIRKKPETDEYIKAASIYPIDPISDIVHIGDKYPAVRGTNDWLSNRLGIAITRRRQYLLYRKEHQKKMQEVHRLREGPDGKTVYSGEGASSYHGRDTFPENKLSLDKQGVRVTPQASRTEYADSAKASECGMNILRTPPLPKRDDGSRVKYGEHFECPYCRRIQRFEEKIDWKKHVLSDLRSYVCTFKPCELNMFDSQRQWFDHELQVHRKQWACQFCGDNSPKTRPELESHLTKVHSDKLKDGKFDVERCNITRIDATCCLLCTEYAEKLQKSNQSTKCDVSLKQFQQHLGGHMEQLALAALSPYETNEDAILEEDEDSEEQEADELLQKLEQEPKSNFSSTLEKIHTLGIRYRKQKRLSEAESLFRQTLAISEKAIGGENQRPENSIMLESLGAVLFEQGKFEEAEELQRRVVEVREKILGQEHPETLRSIQTLGMISFQQGKLEEAVELHRRVLIGREKTLGPEHPDTNMARENLTAAIVDRQKIEDSADKPADTGDLSVQEPEALPSTPAKEADELEETWRSFATKDKKKGKTVLRTPIEEETIPPAPEEPLEGSSLTPQPLPTERESAEVQTGEVEEIHKGHFPALPRPNPVRVTQSGGGYQSGGGFVPAKPHHNADKQGFKVNDKVRVKKPSSSNIWLIDSAYLRDTHWRYVLKNPDDETKFYNGAEEVEEIRLRSAG